MPFQLWARGHGVSSAPQEREEKKKWDAMERDDQTF